MEEKPVIKYKTPRYPDKSVVYLNPGLLKSMPDRWKDNVCIGIAL